MNTWIACIGLAALLFAAPAAGAAPHRIVENFTRGLPSGKGLEASVDFEDPHAGLASARLRYRFDRAKRPRIALPGRARRVPARSGALTLTVAGDGSGHKLRLVLKSARLERDAKGNVALKNVRTTALGWKTIDFSGWQTIRFDLPALENGKKRVRWWHRIALARGGKNAPAKGALGLDELRVRTGAKPNGSALAGVIGPKIRSIERPIEVFADVRSFVDHATEAQLRLTLEDRKGNVAVDQRVRLELEPGEQSERRIGIDVPPQQLEKYLPPFTVSGELISSDLPDAARRFQRRLVVGNNRLLFDDMAAATWRWFAGPPRGGGALAGAYQRASARVQTNARLDRVTHEPGDGESAPRGRYALRARFDDTAMLYTRHHRTLPGDAYRMGFWIRGDGSGAALTAYFLDHTDHGDFWPGGWKRITQRGPPSPKRSLGTLDFKGWRYVTVTLPGRGIGTHKPAGSTKNVDMPLELAGVKIEPKGGSGEVLLGPSYVHTQSEPGEMLALHPGYGDPTHRWGPDHDAHLTVQNGSRVSKHKIEVRWTFRDADKNTLARGARRVTLDAGAAARIDVPLSDHAKKARNARGPLVLEATATIRGEIAASRTRRLALAKPDSKVRVTGFEDPIGYMRLRGVGVKSGGLPPNAIVARPNKEAAHGGERSLEIAWKDPPTKKERKQRKGDAKRPPMHQRFVAVSPPLPGVPDELTLWVHGDGSNVLFYPLIGDQVGVKHGDQKMQWDLFPAAVVDGELEYAVRVDWKGWRRLRFRFPRPAADWRKPGEITAWRPDYPLGLHLAVIADEKTTGDRGALRVDDIRATTHLPPSERLRLHGPARRDSNIRDPGSSVAFRVRNADTNAERTGRARAAIRDWRGDAIGAVEADVRLAPQETRAWTVADALPKGAFTLRIELARGDGPAASHRSDVIVGDPKAWLGSEWRSALESEWRLRVATDNRFHLIEEDWDWIERFPGNLQLNTPRRRVARIRKHGGSPYFLLGYSAAWAHGQKLEALEAGNYERKRSARVRGAGGVRVMTVPERLRDWENYVVEMMRGLGDAVAGWILWQNPDAREGPLGVPPEKFSAMARVVSEWQQVYCPKKPVLIGGMGRNTALPYLKRLAKHDGLGAVDGVSVQMNVGRRSPEAARVPRFVRRVRRFLGEQGARGRRVVLRDLDWAIEKGGQGLDAFDQAALLTRADLLLDRFGVRPTLQLANDEQTRLGVGLAYREQVRAPPLSERRPTLQLKPGWLAVFRTRRLLADHTVAASVPIAGKVPGWTRCLVLEPKGDGPIRAALWRAGGDPLTARVGALGVEVRSARDAFGSPVPHEGGAYPLGKIPALFTLEASDPAKAVRSLRLLETRADGARHWAHRPVAAWRSADGGRRWKYEMRKSEPKRYEGRTWTGDRARWRGRAFAEGGEERFAVEAPEGAGLVLRKRYALETSGHRAVVAVNGEKLGAWNLTRSSKDLPGGLREAVYVVPRERLPAGKPARITVRYPKGGNTCGWAVFARDGGDFPLTAMRPVHAAQNVGDPRPGRNVVGGPLAVGETRYDTGIGVYAKSLLEYPLNGQFDTFTAEVGVDAVTGGKGSVVFEVYADGKKRFSSGRMSGLDDPKALEVDVSGVDRLRLIVDDAGDGNKNDAAVWGDARLSRSESREPE